MPSDASTGLSNQSLEDWLNAPDETPPLERSILPPGTQAPAVPTAPASLGQTNAVPAALRPPAGSPFANFQKAMAQQQQDYLSKAQEPGVPLDTESGVSAWERFMLSFRREKEDQVRYLQHQYGEENVRLDPYGELIVRAPDKETGKPKDIIVNPSKMSAKDLIDVAGAFPEIAASILATKGGRAALPASGLKALGRDVLSAAVGGEGAGALKDIAVESFDRRGAPDVGKILKERAEMTIPDIGIGALTMGGGRIFNWAKQPFGTAKPGTIQFDNFLGREHVLKNYGIDVPQTIGESTGSPLFGRSETLFEKYPGGAGPFAELRKKQDDALRALQRIMMGKQPPTDEAAGRQMIDALMQKIQPAQNLVTASEREVQEAGTKAIQNIVSDVTMPQSQVLREETGKAIRQGVIARRDAVTAEADRLYDLVRQAEGGTGKIFGGENLQKDFRRIKDSLPSAQTTKETLTYDQYGNPSMREGVGTQTLEPFVPPNVMSYLQEVSSLKNPKFSLSDLQQMRRDVYDAMQPHEGVPNRGAHFLSEIADSLTKAMDEGVAGLPSGDLKNALEAANAHYKNKVVPFNRIGITELFRKADEPGGVADSEIVSRIFGGGKALDRYNLLRETLGNNSPEFTRLKRAVADNIIERSRYPGDELIDPKSLVKNLSDFQREQGTMTKDIFGTRTADLFKQAKIMAMADVPYGDKINAKDFAKLLADPNPTAQKFRALVMAEKQRDLLYKNEILRSIAKGELPDKSLNPVDFVNRFVEQGTPEQIKQVMGLLSSRPDLLQDVKAKTVEKIFRDAARPATPGDIGKLLSGDPTRLVTATSVFKQIEDPSMQAKLKTIIGPDTYEDLRNYLKIHSALQSKEQAYKAAGGIGAGAQISMLERNLGRFLKVTGVNYLVSKLLTADWARNWLGKVGPRASQDPAFWNTLFTSPIFLQEVAKDFPGAKGSMFINSLKQGMDNWVKQMQGQKPVEQPRQPANVIQGSLQDYLNAP